MLKNPFLPRWDEVRLGCEAVFSFFELHSQQTSANCSMNECIHNFDSPVLSGQFVDTLRVNITEHPTIRNPANWVTCNIVNKYKSSLDFVDCYEGLITIITSNETQQRLIMASAKSWIQDLYPKPVSKYLVEGSGLLNTNQLKEIIQHYAKVIHLAPRTRLDHEKGAPVRFANSAVVTVDDSKELPSEILYTSLNIKRHLKISRLSDAKKAQPQSPESARSLAHTNRDGWKTQLRKGKTVPTDKFSNAAERPTSLQEAPENNSNIANGLAREVSQYPRKERNHQYSGGWDHKQPQLRITSTAKPTISDYLISPQVAGIGKRKKRREKQKTSGATGSRH